MAMYYQNSSEIQGDGLQTLYLMNPNNYAAAYSDTQENMQFLNSAALMPHAPPPPQPHPHLVGIPLSHDPTLAQNTMAAARHHYTMWGAGSLDHNNQPNTTPRGLSLSLSAHHKAISGDRDFPAGQGVISPKHRSPPTTTELNSVIMGSKYLKTAQELLDEVVNVGNHHRPHKAKAVKDSSATEAQTANEAAADLSTAQRQEIQMKKAKLTSMLDEVEQRCRQYHQQMQMIISAFEQVAGTGSARSYTQLALKTILKQFRCLKSTICAQIKALNKSLGEEECPDNNFEGSRLKFVDHEVRQQRAMQQLGMMHSNAWRPQRGLPERAVSVLRAWLFQHFLHPYPKDSDKQMLAKQTGLTRSQVSNWFINARVRLWKPMVEEMYQEETKNQQQNQNGSSIKPEPDAKTPPTAPEISHPSPPGPCLPSRTNFAQLISSLNMENEKNPKKARNAGVEHVKERFSTENYLPMAANMNRYEMGMGMGMGEIDQQLATGFGHGHGNNTAFSLSLALPPTQTFLSHRSFEIEPEGGRINEGGYEMLDFQNRKQPFPPHLMQDFVA